MREAKTGWQSFLKRLRVRRPPIPIVHSNTDKSQPYAEKEIKIPKDTIDWKALYSSETKSFNR